MTIKPVADLYLITYEDGKPYKYTRDANEAIDAIGRGFKVEEFVSLENPRAAMLQGADQAPVKQPSSNSVLGWLRADYQDDNRGLRGNAPLFVLGKKDPSTVWGLDYIPLTSNSPVIPDGWVACSERMPMDGFDVLCASEFDGPGDWRRKVGYWHRGKWVVYGASWTPTHWMPLPAAPQQEVK